MVHEVSHGVDFNISPVEVAGFTTSLSDNRENIITVFGPTLEIALFPAMLEVGKGLFHDSPPKPPWLTSIVERG